MQQQQAILDHVMNSLSMQLKGSVSAAVMSLHRAGSLTENVSAIVSGKASPHGKLEYILGGISAVCLILTTIWATIIIRSHSAPRYTPVPLRSLAHPASGIPDSSVPGLEKPLRLMTLM